MVTAELNIPVNLRDISTIGYVIDLSQQISVFILQKGRDREREGGERGRLRGRGGGGKERGGREEGGGGCGDEKEGGRL